MKYECNRGLCNSLDTERHAAGSILLSDWRQREKDNRYIKRDQEDERKDGQNYEENILMYLYNMQTFSYFHLLTQVNCVYAKYQMAQCLEIQYP